VQGEGGLPLDHHLHCPREDVPGFFTWMDVPAGLDTAWNLGEHLNDLPARNRGCAVLKFCALELARERVVRLLRGRHRVGHYGRVF
jgi:hypothetical protein